MLLLLCALFTISFAALDDVLYVSQGGDPCVLLLDKDGQYGCKTLRDGVIAPLHPLETDQGLEMFISSPPSDPVILVMPTAQLAVPQSIDRLHATGKVKGAILLEVEDRPKSPFSPAYNMPDEEQVTSGFTWNPNGTGLLMKRIPFPLWRMQEVESSTIFMKAMYNRQAGMSYPVYGAEIISFMHPEDVENSFTCLKRGTCLPLGGYSTWTSIAPIDPNKEIVLIIASMDTKNLFQRKSIGANSDMSGTAALLAALDAIMRSGSNVSTWVRQPVFFWFDGESYGNLGTKKFLDDLLHRPCDVQGNSPFTTCAQGGSAEYKKINIDKIVSIIELKQVGSPIASGLFIHQQHHNMTTYTASISLKVGETMKPIPVNSAASDTPSVPPSCTLSLIKLNESFAEKSVVIADHSREYVNKYYDSVFDDAANIASTLVCDASTLLYRIIYAIGNNVTSIIPSEFQKLNSDCSLVDRLVDCLVFNSTCEEARQTLPGMDPSKADEWPIHYVGVWRSELTQHKKFIHDWVYNKTSFSRRGSCHENSECTGDEMCIAGSCQLSTTYFHAATPLNVELIIGELSAYWSVIDMNSKDPLWTESNWKPLSLRVFLMGDPIQDYIFLALAIIEIIVVVVVVIIARRNFEKNFRVL